MKYVPLDYHTRKVSRLERDRAVLAVLSAVLLVAVIVLLITGRVTKKSGAGGEAASQTPASEAQSEVQPEVQSDAASDSGGAERQETRQSGEKPDLSAYPEELQELWEKNEDARSFVEDYWEKKDQTFEIDLSEYKDCDQVPLLMQWDERWGYSSYSGGMLGLTGCGPTCLSMVGIYLTGNTDLNPKYVAQFSEEQGYSVEGSGTAWTLISQGAKSLGMDAMELPLNESRIVDSLRAGRPVICVLGPGDFTDNGHFIVLTGYENGAFTVNDPNSIVRSQQTWTFDQLKGQIKNLWALWNDSTLAVNDGTGEAAESGTEEKYIRLS